MEKRGSTARRPQKLISSRNSPSISSIGNEVKPEVLPVLQVLIQVTIALMWVGDALLCCGSQCGSLRCRIAHAWSTLILGIVLSGLTSKNAKQVL
eukprot:1159972-Pelagomonas_calceolata.AAC.20